MDSSAETSSLFPFSSPLPEWFASARRSGDVEIRWLKSDNEEDQSLHGLRMRNTRLHAQLLVHIIGTILFCLRWPRPGLKLFHGLLDGSHQVRN